MIPAPYAWLICSAWLTCWICPGWHRMNPDNLGAHKNN
jgi:hypothetical protein